MKLKLTRVRLSFPDIFEAVQYKGKGEFRYNAAFLVEPGSANDKAIQADIKAAAVEKYQKKADANLKAWTDNATKFCYTSGDLKEYDGYEGMMVLSAHRNQKQGAPGVFDRVINPATGKVKKLTAADGKPYAGCYVNATVEIYAQTGENAGIRCSLVGVQFVEDGDAFGGGAPPTADDFEDLGVPETEDDLTG